MKDEFDPVAFGNRVAGHIDLRGSFRAAAAETGISSSTLCRIAAGHKPSIDHYFKLVKWITGKTPWQ